MKENELISLKDQLNGYNKPTHIAFILDGNGRWAKSKGLDRTLGHKKGCETLIEIFDYCYILGIKYVSCYAFSTENWSRPKKEVDYLMNLFTTIGNKYLDKIKEKNILVNIIGSKDNLNDEVLNTIDNINKLNITDPVMTINICFNYGAYTELADAIKQISTDVLNNKINVNDINPALINNYLYTKNCPNVDLLIRTSGEMRISNFMLWQISYSELMFTKTYWPDFSCKELNECIIEYNKRDRRFGGIKEC